MKDIFECNIGGHICYTLDALGRMKIVRECDDIEALKTTFKTTRLQKTVEKAIILRIKRLEKSKGDQKCQTQT